MSVVTNVILHIPLSAWIDEDDSNKGVIEEVNKFFNKQDLRSVDGNDLPFSWYGGSKMLECELYIGAFNYLDEEGFIKHLKSIAWEQPQNVQLFLKRDDDDRFEIINLNTSRLNVLHRPD